jgi:hypothetical protein
MATAEAVQELIDKMTEEREALLGQAGAMTDAEASYAPPDAQGEAGWSAKEQLAHLAEMETTYRAWVRTALDRESPDLSHVRGEPPAIPLEEARDRTVAELVAELRAQRAETLRLIDSMTPEQFERTASQPMFGRLTALQWLRSYYRHDRMHRDQMAGREPQYKPRYAGGGGEPDQRRVRGING